MHVELTNAGNATVIDVPDDAVVVRPATSTPLADPERSCREAVRPWLRGLQPPAVVVLSDLPIPQVVVLPTLLSELARVGLRRESVRLLHGPAVLLDGQAADRHEAHIHESADRDSHVVVGEVGGAQVLFDGLYVGATTRLTLGVVQPHFACGFTGGPETVCPGIAGQPTVDAVRALSDDRGATWLSTRGNPVHEFIRAAVKLAPPRLSIDVTVDSSGALTGVWCGPLPHAHQAACSFVESNASRALSSYADVVVTAGEPLTAAIAGAARAVRPGGTIVAVVEGAKGADSWQSGTIDRVRERAHVLLSSGADVAATLRSLTPGRVCVLPDGARTVVSVPVTAP